MASVTSAEVQCSTYIWARVVVDYSGTSATAHIQYKHTYGGYTGYTGWFNYGAGGSSASGSWSNETVTTSWTTKMSIGFSISENGGTYNIWCSGYDYNDFSVNVSIPAQYSAPSISSVAVNSKTHNSANMTIKGSYGKGTGSYQIEVGLGAQNAWQSPSLRSACVKDGRTTYTTTVNNSSTQTTTLTLVGNTKYWYGGYIHNGYTGGGQMFGTIYLPCPPLSALSLSSQTYAAYNTVNAVISYTRQNDGGAETRTGKYRYSTDNGTSWTGWTSFGTVSNSSGTFTATLPTSKTVLLQARLETPNGGASESKQVSITTKTTHTAPNFSNFTYEDISSAVLALTNNSQIFVQGQSHPRVIISVANKATANDGATITGYTASLNAESIQIPYSSSADTVGVFSTNRPTASGTLALSVAANDSLSLAKSVSKNVTVIPWAAPTLTATATRQNNFENNTTIKISGTYSQILVNNTVKNTLAVAYRFKKSTASSWGSWTSKTVTISGSNFTVADFVLSFDNEYQWDIEVRAVDKFTTTTVALSLAVGKPIFFISRNKKVSVNRKPTNYNADLDVEGKVYAEDSPLS